MSTPIHVGRITPLIIVGEFPWPNHSLVWNDDAMSGMHCEKCGIPVLPEMTMRELTGPCSGSEHLPPVRPVVQPPPPNPLEAGP